MRFFFGVAFSFTIDLFIACPLLILFRQYIMSGVCFTMGVALATLLILRMMENERLGFNEQDG